MVRSKDKKVGYNYKNESIEISITYQNKLYHPLNLLKTTALNVGHQTDETGQLQLLIVKRK